MSSSSIATYWNALKISNQILHAIQSQNARVKINDIFSNVIFQEESRRSAVERLQKEMKSEQPFSICLHRDIVYSQTLIPGACLFGGVGPWRSELAYPSCEQLDCTDKTQVILIFNSQKECTSPNVTGRLAFQTPIAAPTYDVFDPAPIAPSRAIDEPVNNPIISLMSKCVTLLKQTLISRADERNLPGIVSIDCRSLETKEVDGMKRFDSSLQARNKSFTLDGYRLKCLSNSVVQKSAFPLHKFGIALEDVSPNLTSVNKRSIWHSEEFCTHLLSKQRGSEDFLHMVRHESTGKDGGTPNDPLISIIHMDAYKAKYVQGTKVQVQEEAERQKVIDAEKQKRKRILKMKIEAADRMLENGLKEICGTCVFEGCDESKSVLRKYNSTIEEGIKSPGSKWRSLSDEGGCLIDVKSSTRVSYKRDSEHVYNLNQPRAIAIIPSSDATGYSVDDIHFQTTKQTQFVDDLLEDRFHLSHQISEGQKVKDFLLNSDQQYALEHILKVPLGDGTEAVVPLEMQTENNIRNVTDKMNLSKEERVIQATRHADYEVLEEMLDDCGVDIDTMDEYGNTLLILAGQQGNKKLCKFLLRRGAYINAQNHAGNTTLHYLHEYAHLDLADYMRRKGADATYLNALGLTCYEGVNSNNL